MFTANNPGKGKKPWWDQTIFNKLILCLAVALLFMVALPASRVAAATLQLGGNLGLSSSSSSVTETDIRAGNVSGNDLTITLTLSDNTWAGDVVSNPAKLNTLMDGFEAATESDQWNSVKDVSSFTRVSDTEIDITLPVNGVSDYDIAADQTINISIAPSLLGDSSYPVSNTPNFSIIADCQAALSSSINSATDIVNGGNVISIFLTNNTWNAGSGIINRADKRDKFFESFKTSDESSEWETVINALKAAPDPSDVLTLSSDRSTITITLPAVTDYQISTAQTITVDYSVWETQGFITDELADSQPDLTFSIAPSFTTAKLSTTIATAADVGTGGKTITITLSNNSWQTDVTTKSAKFNALIDGFTAASDTDSWNLVKTKFKSSATKTLTSTGGIINNVLTITLPGVTGYSIATDQTITVNIPATLLTNNHPVTVTPNTFAIKAASAATVTGTAVQSLTEADILKGGKTIIITLTSDIWNSDVISNAIKREALMDGFKFANSTTDNDQWNAMLEVIKASASFTRVNDTTVSITLPRTTAFNISGQLQVKLTVPGSVIKYLDDDKFLPEVDAFTISNVTTQSAKLSGTAVNGITETDIVTGGKTIVITLTNDVWKDDVATDQRNTLLSSLTTTGTDENTWNNVRDASTVVRNSDTVVTITLPKASGFNLSGDLTITPNIPNAVLTTASTSITASSFTVSAITAVLSGTAISAPLDSSSIIAGGKTIIITLKNATWVSDVVTNNLPTLIGGFKDSDGNVLNLGITQTYVTRTSNTVVTIKLPPVPGYTGSDQAFTLTILQALIVGGNKDVKATPNLQIGSVASATLDVSNDKLDKLDIVDGGDTITIELEDCTWVTDVVSNTGKLKTLLKGFTPDSDTASWNLVIAAIQANLNKVSLNSNNTIITIKLPPVPDYDPVNEQKVSLTIPKNLLVGATENIVTGNKIKIELPSSTKRGTLQSMLDDGSLADYINEKSLQKIILEVPVKYITSVVVGQTKLDDTVIVSLDIYTDSDVDKVRVIVDGETYTSTKSVEAGEGKKYNIGFSYKDDTTTSSSSKSSSASSIDAIISVSGQSDVTIKINGSKTYSLTPSTALNGSYSLYKLVNDSKLFTNILNYYIPEDIDVKTL